MATMMGERAKAELLMMRIAELADRKVHSLAPDMTSGKRKLSLAAASRTLEYLMRCPDRPGNAAATPPRLADFKGTPEGWYATPSRTGSNDLDFWHVEVETKGQWKGWSFARRALGGPTDKRMRTVAIDTMEQRFALQAIHAMGVEESQEKFATSVQRCKDCSTLLTDDVSRAARLGPDCRANRARREGA